MGRNDHGLLLVVEDAADLAPLVSQLRTLGCPVYCASSLDAAADLIRAGLPRRLVLVHVSAGSMSAARLHDELVSRLPGWAVEMQGHHPPSAAN